MDYSTSSIPFKHEAKDSSCSDGPPLSDQFPQAVCSKTAQDGPPEAQISSFSTQVAGLQPPSADPACLPTEVGAPNGRPCAASDRPPLFASPTMPAGVPFTVQRPITTSFNATPSLRMIALFGVDHIRPREPLEQWEQHQFQHQNSARPILPFPTLEYIEGWVAPARLLPHQLGPPREVEPKSVSFTLDEDVPSDAKEGETVAGAGAGTDPGIEAEAEGATDME